MSIRTTRITIETESVTIIRRAAVESRWCPECLQQVESVALQDLPDIEGGGEQVRDWVAQHKLHVWQPDGQSTTRLCLKSLIEIAAQGRA